LWLAAVSWRLLSTAGLFLAAWAVTEQVGISAVLALGDLALRPLLRKLHALLWRESAASALQDGAGI
jgi:hypothetical protein